MAKGVGLIDEDYFKDLGIIRRIRNDAAHSMSAFSFEDVAVSDRANSLRDFRQHTIRLENMSEARARFCACTMALTGKIGLKLPAFIFEALKSAAEDTDAPAELKDFLAKGRQSFQDVFDLKPKSQG